MIEASRVWTDAPALVLLYLSVALWTVAVLGHILRSHKSVGAKVGWMLASALLMPLGGAAYYLFGRSSPRSRLASLDYGCTVGGIFIAALVAALVDQSVDTSFRWVWLIALSGVTFAAYGYDKIVSANQAATRIPERTLHLLAIAGGFAGAWLGMAIGHKRNWAKHRLFPILLLTATALHLGAATRYWSDGVLLIGCTAAAMVAWIFGGSSKGKRAST